MPKLGAMFDAFVTFQARMKPRATAIVAPARAATYGELEDDVNRLAAGLRGLGVTPARGATALRIGDPYLKHLAFLALARLGVVSAPADDAGADLELTDYDEPEAAGRILLKPAWIAAVFAAEPRPVTPVRGPPETVIRVMLSSGSTRAPRRVAKTWRSMESSALTVGTSYLSGKGGLWIATTGLDSMLGQNFAITAWAIGAAVGVGFAVEDLGVRLDEVAPTVLGMTPVQLQMMLTWLPKDLRPLPDLRIITGGSGLSPAVAKATRLRLTPDLMVAYGATECGAVSMGDASVLDQAAGATGYLHPDAEVEILDADGRPLAPGEPGEVRIRNPRLATGYIGDPEASAGAFRDGWFHPGDVGRLLPSGVLVIDGRTDERMIVNGRKFLPNLLEEVALAVPGVVDCAAFAVPDAAGHDICWLAAVTAEGFNRATLAAAIAAKGDSLPPVRFAWTDAIPRNAMGKIERTRLREEALAVLRGGAARP